MHTRMTQRTLMVALLLLLFGRHPIHAQDGQDWKASAISSVMDYRASVLGDTTAKFDGCRIGRHLDDRSPLPVGIAEPVRGMLQPCGAPRGRYSVAVDSLARRADGSVMAYVTVVRAEWVHREDYTLVPHDSPGPFMGVREVRLWGAVQAYPRRPAPAPPE
jgi:hypothetical protein